MKKKWLLFLIPLMILAALLLTFAGEDGHRRQAAMLLAVRQEEFSRAAEAALAGEPVREKDLFGVDSWNVWPAEDGSGQRMVDFYIGGWGIGSGTGYWGIYTTSDGVPMGWQGTDMELSPSGSGFLWKETDGDNAYYTEELASGWWYYQMEL